MKLIILLIDIATRDSNHALKTPRLGKAFQAYEAEKAVAQRCSVKKVFLEIWQNSQENTSARDFFLIN